MKLELLPLQIMVGAIILMIFFDFNRPRSNNKSVNNRLNQLIQIDSVRLLLNSLFL